MNIRLAEKNRRIQLLLRVYEDWTNQDWLIAMLEVAAWEWDSIEDFFAKYGAPDKLSASVYANNSFNVLVRLFTEKLLSS